MHRPYTGARPSSEGGPRRGHGEGLEGISGPASRRLAPHTFLNMGPIRRSRAPDRTTGMNRSTRVVGAALSFLIAPLALAQAPAPPAPPQEAVDACAGRESGAACTFQHGDHSVAGICHAMPGGTAVACGPMHFHLMYGPPPEALEACKGQQEGATCQFTAPRGETIAGVCRSGPQGEPAACAPKDLPPPVTGAGGSGG